VVILVKKVFREARVTMVLQARLVPRVYKVKLVLKENKVRLV
jgi:hypothetical protein